MDIALNEPLAVAARDAATKIGLKLAIAVTDEGGQQDHDVAVAALKAAGFEVAN